MRTPVRALRFGFLIPSRLGGVGLLCDLLRVLGMCRGSGLFRSLLLLVCRLFCLCVLLRPSLCGSQRMHQGSKMLPALNKRQGHTPLLVASHEWAIKSSLPSNRAITHERCESNAYARYEMPMISQDDARGKTGYKHRPMLTFDCDAASSSLAFDWAVEASLALAGAAVVSFALL